MLHPSRRSVHPLPPRQPVAAVTTAVEVVLALVAMACTSTPATSPPTIVEQARAGAPNVVIVLTDDQRYDTLWAMPNVRHQLVDKGTKFRNGFVVNPLCCPSRASILTGNYSSRTGVWSNGGKYGGFGAFDDTTSLATRLQGAGYHTGLVGKYLNHYDDPSYTPPGWDSWQPMLAKSEGKYYDYDLNDNGTPVHYGHAPSDYSTDVLMHDGVSFIQDAPADVPLFLYLATKAPHGSATPAPRDKHTLSERQLHFNESWNEGSVDDKPAYIRTQRPLGITKQFRFRRGLLDADRSLGAVDDGVQHLIDALTASGRMENTIFIFLSDNATAWGEHRWGAKSVPYEETIRVPLVVRYDALAGPDRPSGALALNIDLAPTILEVAGLQHDGMDGQSLVPFLTDPSQAGRKDFMVQHMQLIRPEGRDDPVPSYCAVRSHTHLFTLYATGERELYDLRVDPAELHNLAKEPGSVPLMAAMESRVRQLCDPAPPGFPLDLLVDADAGTPQP